MQFAKLAIFACLLIAVALAAETGKKENHKNNRNKAHHKSRSHKAPKVANLERKHKENRGHKTSNTRNHGSRLVPASRSHGYGKSVRQAEPQPSPDCTCSAWQCPTTTTTTTTETTTTVTTTPTPQIIDTTPTPAATPTPDPTEITTTTTLKPTVPEEGNWELEIKISGTVTVKLIYNADLNFFGIYNSVQKLAIIFNGVSGFVGIFNIETNAALILNLSANLGIYIENAGDIKGQFGANLDLEVAFKFLFDIVKQTEINANGENTFKITVFLQAIVEGKLNADIAVFKKISVNFAAYIAILVNLKKEIAIYGVVSVIIPVFVEITNVSSGLLQLFAAITLNLSGKFTATVFALIRKKLELEIAAGVLVLAGITGAIRAIGSIFVDLNAAISAYIKNLIVTNVNTGQITTIDGVVTITTAIVGKGSWLIKISNANVDVGIFYDKSSNTLGFLNAKLNVAVVIVGEGNLYGFVNIATGGVLVVNYLTNNARVVTAVELKGAFAVDILLIGNAFANAAAIIKKNAKGLDSLFAPKDSFNLGAVVAAIALDFGWEAAYNLVFVGSAAVKAAVDLHFKALFLAIRVKLGIFGALAKGGLALILPICGSIKIVSEGFFKIILAIFRDLKGTFDAEFMLNIFVDFNVSIVQYIRGEVKALFGVVLKAIGKFANFVGSIFGAVTGVINVIKEAHANVNVSISFGGGFGGSIGGVGGVEGTTGGVGGVGGTTGGVGGVGGTTGGVGGVGGTTGGEGEVGGTIGVGATIGGGGEGGVKAESGGED